jgi:hypothetical protein
VTIELSPAIKDDEVECRIFNVFETEVYHCNTRFRMNNLTLDISGWSAGIYFFTMKVNGNKYQSMKFIKE